MADHRTRAGHAATSVVTVLTILATLSSSDARAQSSRAEEIARQQAEKARHLTPPERSRGERALALVQRIVAEGGNGLYPWIGSVYPGGLLALGAGYEHRLSESGSINTRAAWSLKNFKQARADVKFPEFAERRIALNARASWLDAPEVAFYGVGNDTRRDDRAHYSYSPARAGVDGTVRLSDRLAAGGGAEYLDIDSGVEDVAYVASRVFVAFDWRDTPGYSRGGGLYRIQWSPYSDRGTNGAGFREAEIEAIQLLPLFRRSSVLAFRGLFTTTDVPAGNHVPVFMLPSLGGGSTLRGYPSWRFRDRNRVLVSGEYRWTPAQVMDMAIFVDAGQVAARPREIEWRNLKTDYGIGVRLHGPSFTALRLDVARGSEGWVLNLGAGAAF